MSYKGTPYTKSTFYRLRKRARALGCSMNDVPDGRGKHNPRHARYRLTTAHGYIKIHVGHQHLLADDAGYVYEHLLIWASAGNPIPTGDQVLHHRDENKQNNALDNLEMMTRAEHNQHHKTGKKRDPK